jgi:hypothetical protein
LILAVVVTGQAARLQAAQLGQSRIKSLENVRQSNTATAAAGTTGAAMAFRPADKILWSGEQRGQQKEPSAIALHRTGMEQAMADLERTAAGWQH